MALQTKTITVDGRRVQYLEAGPAGAAPIIFLHGGVGDAAFHWAQLLPELATSYRLIAPDMPGFGQSDPLPQMTYAALTGWVRGIFQALGFQQAVLVGHSVGGLVARLVAAAYPQDVPALILINGGVLPGKSGGFIRQVARIPVIDGWFFRWLAGQGIGNRAALEWLVVDHTDTERLTDQMVEAAQASVPGLVAVMQMQTLDTLPESRVPMVPTMLLWGVEDTFSPISAGERVHKAIPGSELRRVEGTQHAPHIDEPDVVAFQIQSFVDNLGRTGSPG
jgi:pimeloyl-ACP methyl ester carboxylesterase